MAARAYLIERRLPKRSRSVRLLHLAEAVNTQAQEIKNLASSLLVFVVDATDAALWRNLARDFAKFDK